MRILPSFAIVVVLALLLIGTTPMGTGAGVHQFDLVHPLFDHVHIVNGQILTHDQLLQGTMSSRPPVGARRVGPALGATAGANQGFDGLGSSPVVPARVLSFITSGFSLRLGLTLPAPGGRLVEAPPAPPPTSAA